MTTIETGTITRDSMFGDMTNKATILKWGKRIMVDVVQENSKTAVVQYGVDPETNRPILMKIHKVKNAYRALTPEEAREIVASALAHVRDTNSEEVDEPATSQRS
jgi:hypothetical protein